MIPRLQGVFAHTLPLQLRPCTPFHRPSLDLPVFVRSQDEQERMRVIEQKLLDVPFNRLRLVREVGCKGVMGVTSRARRERRGNE